jgi:hypothetical protein
MNLMNETKTIISICDHSGGWSRPYAEAGYNVLRVDPKHPPGFTKMADGGWAVGMTAQEILGHYRTLMEMGATPNVHGLMLAPVCTDFTNSGARWWAGKDASGSTEQSLELVDACLALVELLKPRWWVLENPVGRLPKLRPQLGKPLLYIHPHQYALLADDPDKDAYTKKTGLWGSFNPALERAELDPVFYTKGGKRGSWMWAHLGGKSDRTKELRSVTPQGFARAFFKANP